MCTLLEPTHLDCDVRQIGQFAHVRKLTQHAATTDLPVKDGFTQYRPDMRRFIADDAGPPGHSGSHQSVHAAGSR